MKIKTKQMGSINGWVRDDGVRLYMPNCQIEIGQLTQLKSDEIFYQKKNIIQLKLLKLGSNFYF